MGRIRRLVVYDVESHNGLYESLNVIGRADGIRFDDLYRIEPKPRKGSQRARHGWAAADAETDLYVVTDDDILPIDHVHRPMDGMEPQSWLEYARATFERLPELGMASALTVPGGTDPMSVPPEYQPKDPDLFDVGSIGGLRIVRRGAVDPDRLPPLDPDHRGGYDTTLTQHLRSGGAMTGYLYRWCALHCGFFHSELWTDGAMRIPGG